MLSGGNLCFRRSMAKMGFLYTRCTARHLKKSLEIFHKLSVFHLHIISTLIFLFFLFAPSVRLPLFHQQQCLRTLSKWRYIYDLSAVWRPSYWPLKTIQLPRVICTSNIFYSTLKHLIFIFYLHIVYVLLLRLLIFVFLKAFYGLVNKEVLPIAWKGSKQSIT